MKTTRKYLENLVSGLSHAHHIEFVEGDKWVTNIKKKVLTYDPRDLLAEDHIVSKGLILHEMGHLEYTIQAPATPLQKEYPSLQGLYNSLEDIRIERKLIEQYGDFASQALHATNRKGTQMHKEQARKKRPIGSKVDQVGIAFLLMNLNYMGQLSPSDFDLITSNFDSDVQDVLRTMSFYRHIQEIRNLPDTAAVKDYTDRAIVPKIKKFLDKNEESSITCTSKAIHGSKTGHLRTNSYSLPTDEELDGLLAPYINTLARNLKNILEEKKAVRYNGAYRRGKLLSKNVYKITTDESRIFSRRNRPDTLDYQFTFLLDESGSMDGTSHENAFIAAYLIDRVAHRMKIPTVTYIYDEKVDSRNTVSDYRRIRCGGNNEPLVLDTAYRQMDEKKSNLFFMLTDGLCGADPSGEIKKIEKRGGIVVAIGVGIPREQLSQYFTNTIGVPKVENLPMAMILLLKGLIHR